MPWLDDYELIDAGDDRRLERFGPHVVDRPAPGMVGPRHRQDRWREADLVYERGEGWSGDGLVGALAGWTMRIADLAMDLRPTHAGQVGVFPEHAAMLPWLRGQVVARTDPSVLNLFASTGLTSLALARAGAAVAHVDASRSAIGWARRNAAANGLQDRAIRWLVDDARVFVAREIRRGRRYDGAVLDPPTYGHGPTGKDWRLERDLAALADEIGALLQPDAFLLVTAHSAAIDPFSLGGLLGGDPEIGALVLDAASGAQLPLGAYARLDRRA